MLLTSAGDCSKKTDNKARYKGRFEIAGICMNYTIQLLEGTIDSSAIATNWTDEVTGKSYTNVFGLKNPCVIPSTIKQGDEFYFYIDTTKKKDCIACLAYYPTPPKKLSIIIVQ